MHKFICSNDRILDSENANLSAFSAAFFYGKGIFTTLAIYRRKPFLWERHWQRLIENAAKTGISLTKFSEKTVKNLLFELLEANKTENSRARITFFDESKTAIWNTKIKRQTALLIISDDFRKTGENLKLTVSPNVINSKSPLTNIKSCNYLEKILMLEESQKRGFNEAVCLNEKGEIASAVMANLFWIKHGKIFTPPIITGCLAGTTRGFLMENFDIEEKIIGLEELLEADEIFLTSAGIGIKSAAKIEKISLDTKITQKLRARFQAFI